MIDHADKYRKISEKYNIPIEVAQKICDSQFDFTKSVISKGSDEPVYLQYIGRFFVYPNRRRYVKERQERIRKINEERKKNKHQE